MGKKAPIFILGAPRSGTTFLASLLKGKEYGAPFETHFITKYYKKLTKYGEINEFQNFHRLIRDILAERSVMQWNQQLDVRLFYESLEPCFDFSETLNTYGYQTSTDEKPVSFLLRLGYFIHHYVLLFWYLFVINVFVDFKIRFMGKQPFSE